jgi:hypothetical protein
MKLTLTTSKTKDGYEVTVEYDGGIDRSLDAALHELAGKLGADSIGSGCFLMEPQTRDIQFAPFKTQEAADQFVAQAQAL